MIKAEVIRDSVSPQGIRLTTFKLRYPKFIHGEFMTHRVLSRNASSSRAVPSRKLIEEAMSDTLRAEPVAWGKDQKGMQAFEELEGDALEAVKGLWRAAALSAAQIAQAMMEAGAHKQIVNRVIEPFTHINVVVTATELDNFFGLRLDKGADPTMRTLAIAMWQARSESTPELLNPGEWHLPFIKVADVAAAFRFSEESAQAGHFFGRFVEPQEVLLWVSAARCARVSYESFVTGKDSTIEEDIELFQKLLGCQPLHASPAEHQATPDEWLDKTWGSMTEEAYFVPHWKNSTQHGNFRGWRQHRQMIPGQDKAPIPPEYL